MQRRVLIGSLVLLLLLTGLAAAEWESYKALYSAGEYQQLATMCQGQEDAIDADAGAHIIYKYCGMAHLRQYEKTKQGVDLTYAVKYLENSIAFSYSEEASFNLGVARMQALDHLSDGADMAQREYDALNEMWEAMRNLHAQENFARETLSDNLLIWSRDFRDEVIERVLKSEDAPGRARLLAAYLRMLADRFELVDPTKADSEVRQSNLKLFKDWMTELHELSYFDNNPVVGMYKYKANRHREKYDQSEKTEADFTKALHFYNEALKRVRTNKARAVLNADVAYLCSLYNSKDNEKLVSYYKIGFTNAYEGLNVMAKINQAKADSRREEYPYEMDSSELIAQLQKSYGSNLTGLEYFHHLRKDHRSVVSLKEFVFNSGFNWEGKETTFLLIADAADKLASNARRNRRAFDNYKEICLFASTRAFKATLQKHGGRAPVNDAEFCRVYQNHVNYLRRFGEAIEARELTLRYDPVCQAAAAE
ncbi:MAG: hypothetical protein P9L99_07170 [Candidatus Lernaella stagnicola]|nr:hypothetical protein [Candidatus Lernaella stagnicola]